MKTYTNNPQQIDDSIHLEGIDYHLTKKQTRFFVQFKIGDHWVFGTPVKKHYGHKTIEGCQDFIDVLERQVDGVSLEYRIKEEEV